MFEYASTVRKISHKELVLFSIFNCAYIIRKSSAVGIKLVLKRFDMTTTPLLLKLCLSQSNIYFFESWVVAVNLHITLVNLYITLYHNQSSVKFKKKFKVKKSLNHKKYQNFLNTSWIYSWNKPDWPRIFKKT